MLFSREADESFLVGFPCFPLREKSDSLFRSKDVEKAGTGFQRVNELCNRHGVSWIFRKEAYGFFFEFIRPNAQINVQINVELSAQEQLVFI